VTGTGTLECDDDNVCTDDSCDPDVGCLNIPNIGACDDGDDCTEGEHCEAGVCEPGEVVVECNDNDPCTDDTCNPDGGCVFTPNQSTVCDDNNPCTIGDFCEGGTCMPGEEQLDCDDLNECTNDSCQSAAGCVYNNVASDTPCGQEPGWTCQGGQCMSPDQPTKLVFVVSQGRTGNLGGIAGADAYCQQLADAAGHQGTFKAWLSTSSVSSSPSVRFTKSNIPYAMVNGEVIATDWNDLTDGEIAVPLNIDENGNTPSGTSAVWSYTRVDGTPGLFGNANHKCYGGDCHCKGWTTTATQGSPTPGAAVGQRHVSNDNWTDYSFSNSCGSMRFLYCFEQ